jgi:hypothetical protein
MDRRQAEAMMFAVRAAIIDASPVGDDEMLVVDLDAALSALVYIIAAIGWSCASHDARFDRGCRRA